MKANAALPARRRMGLIAASCALVLTSAAVAAQSAAAAPMPRASAILAKTGAGPDGIAVDAMGNVYTANSRANTVTKIDANGKATQLGTTGQTPRGIAVDGAGNVYTSNLGDGTVTKITPSGTSSTLGTTGRQPIGIALDSAGNVYTTNYLDSTVTKITPAGASSTLGTTGSRPLGIAVDSAGNVYTANEGANNVTKITPQGASSVLGTTGAWPQALALDSAGNVYTANWNSRNVSKITPQGTSTILGTTGRRPIGLAIDPSGNVYTANDGASSVTRITPSGQSKVVAQTGRRPIAIASDAAGFLYVSNFLTSTVTEVFPQAPAKPGVITLSTVTVGSASNQPAWIIPFYNDVYQNRASCLAAFPAVRAGINANPDPSVQTVSATSCMSVGAVDYTYRIGETELTTAQYVTFLNTADPMGHNPRHLWDIAQSSRVWPKYGSINKNMRAPRGQRYYVSSPAWANKPYNQGDFSRGARLANAIDNGKVLSKKTNTITTAAGTSLTRTVFTIRLSTKTETGMYTMKNRKATRNSTSGFAVSSQDEWIKAAYFDPNGGGKYSWWDYPTNPGVYTNCPVDVSGCAAGQQPNQTQLDATGNVTNAGTQPLASFEAVPGTAPDWCPPQFTAAQCQITPFGGLAKIYVGNVSSVGQAATRSPWGTLDQGGNVVETTDTISPPPPDQNPRIVWRRWHGGVVTATAYQMWLSAVGTTPQTIPGYAINPWRGIRLTVRGQ